MEVGHQPFAQKKPEQLVYLELGAGNGGMLLSVSEEGFRFRAVSPVRANGTLPFAFSLDGTHRLEGSGTIEWLEEDGKSGGMRFTEVSEEFRAALARWLASEPAGHPPGREVTPVAAAPVDTMEQIRRDLRAGYPVSERPAESASPLGERKTVASVPARKAPERKLRPVFSERNPEAKESRTAGKLFSPAIPSPPQTEKPPLAGSAFLKRPAEAKPTPPVPPTTPAARAATPATFSSFAAKPAEVQPPAEPRPYIPPIEDSFESAWEHAKLSAPPDSPHLSRAAAGSIIAIALAVILGALAYNFRQDIGDAFIQLGREISGDSRSLAPATREETKRDSQPSAAPNAEQKAPDPASPSRTSSGETGSAAAQNTDSSHPAPSPAEGTAATKNGASPSGATPPSGSNPGPPSVKPREASPVEVPPEAGKAGTAAEAGTGQEEFDAAREILQGSNRRRELPKAVDLLWSGVKKGYVPAEVTLADLFLRGEGVGKNCDQARVLLVAASKKGSFDARQMLEQMAEQGCE